MSIPPTLIMTLPAFSIIQVAQKNSFHHSGSIDTEYHSYWIGFLGNHWHNTKMFHNQAFFWKGSYNTLVCICTNLYHISVHYCEFSSNCCIHFILLVSEHYSVHQIWCILHICLSKREVNICSSFMNKLSECRNVGVISCQRRCWVDHHCWVWCLRTQRGHWRICNVLTLGSHLGGLL